MQIDYVYWLMYIYTFSDVYIHLLSSGLVVYTSTTTVGMVVAWHGIYIYTRQPFNLMQESDWVPITYTLWVCIWECEAGNLTTLQPYLACACSSRDSAIAHNWYTLGNVYNATWMFWLHCMVSLSSAISHIPLYGLVNNGSMVTPNNYTH